MTTQNNNIKLSKIELEAFRGYRDKVTFDFTLPGNKIADIVAIYAPNGFGKTSFFDGIEWNTKGSIERFEENTKIRSSAEEFGGAILKNRESALKNGTVSLVDKNNLYFTRITSSSDKWDLLPGRIDKSSTSPIKNINDYKKFKKIEILPQSRIDSFLSSNTPEEKYQALLDFWDGNDESNYFVGVSKFFAESEKEEENIKSDISKIADKISELKNAENKISFFNSLVKAINSNKINNFNIQEFTERTTDTEFENTVRTINSDIASVSSKLQQTELKKERLIALEEGFVAYFKNKELVLSLKNEVKAFQSILNDFTQIENKHRERKEIDLKLQKEQVDLERIVSIIILKDVFSSIVNQIKVLTEERTNIMEEKVKLIQQKNNADKKLKTEEESLKILITNESKYNENSERLVSLLNSIEANKKRIYLSNSRLSLCKKIKDVRNNIASVLRTELNTVQSISSLNLESFCNAKYTYTEFKGLVSEIKREFNEVELLNKTLKELKSDYSKRGTLNEDLQKIVELGRNFISQTGTNTCPLCNTTHDDFEMLLSRVSKQKDDALNLNQTFERVQSLQTDIEKRTNNLNKQYESLRTLLKQKSSTMTEKLSVINSKILRTESIINYYSGIYTLTEDENRRFSLQYNSIEAENSLLKLQLEDIDELKKSLLQFINDIKKQIEDSEKQVTQTDYRVQEIGAKIEQLNQSPQYIAVNSFLQAKSIPQSEYLEAGLGKIISETEKNIQQFTEQITILQKQIDELTKSTEDKNKNDVQKNLTEKTAILSGTEEKISQYKSQYKSVTEKDNVEIEIIKQNLSSNEDLILNFKNTDVKLRELQSNIQVMQQNLALNTFKVRHREKQQLLKVVKETTEKLKVLKTELSDFLTEKINSVFNQEIINDIYKKIDPHPDFREIKLEPQFDGIKPKLFIKAVDDCKKDEIDPILYLSSAQVNVLSLSIFLAKALQNKGIMINTIFMDDPIQYLDSINILSFIDLLRSITTDKQIDRQVVISTHDENFFNLLKKKFDPQYYNSKFIEFESYGKLKTN
ncbi:MAG TPA: hypothetical protein DCG75_17700 [Bacteroidales bacterium]|nr:hypothetical protein [Bacteroidales bacterium]